LLTLLLGIEAEVAARVEEEVKEVGVRQVIVEVQIETRVAEREVSVEAKVEAEVVVCPHMAENVQDLFQSPECWECSVYPQLQRIKISRRNSSSMEFLTRLS